MNNNYSPEIRAYLDGKCSFFPPTVIPQWHCNNFSHKKEILQLLNDYKDFKSSAGYDLFLIPYV